MRTISLVSKMHHLSPPYLSQGLEVFHKGLSLPLSLYDIYTHGCRMHVDGVSLRVNKKLKCSLISKNKFINMCAAKSFHELLKVHSVRTNISISKYYLLESFFFLVTRGIGNWSWVGTHMIRGPGIHSHYHYTPRCPTPFARQLPLYP